MKKSLRAFLPILLILLTLLSSLSASASEALGEDLTGQDTSLHRTAQLSTNVFWSSAYSDLRTENLITYTPGGEVTPLVSYGSSLTACSTVSSAAKELEAQGYRVIAGINGDFYNTGTGLPIGLVVSDGEVKSSDAGYYAIGFYEDGSAVLGKPALSIQADLGYSLTDENGYETEVVRKITGINKARVSSGGIYLYTYEFNSRHTTGNTESGVDVICSVVSGQLAIGQSLTLSVDSVLEATSATAVPEGKIVLSANSLSGSYYTDALRRLQPGGTLTLSISAGDTRWNGVTNAVGALYALVENGSVVSNLAAGSNPRTAVGQRPDGTLIFYTIDGRQSGHSIGATLTQVAQRLVELGCTEALCLDGGGSTTLTVTKPDSVSAKTVNQPSESSERAVSNQLFLVASATPSGRLDHFYVEPDSRYVLAGSSVTFQVSGVDTNYIPMEADYTLASSDGDWNGSVLTTPAGGGEITVTASGKGKTGSAVVYAIAEPDSVCVKNGSSSVASLTLTPGSVRKLTAAAVYHHQTLKADASAFTWTLSGNIGTVSADGTLTATTPGSGTLTVTAGGKSASVAVTVSRVALSRLDDFESSVPALTDYSYGGTLSSTAVSSSVKLGRRAARLDYSLTSDGSASFLFSTPYSLGSAYNQLNFWIQGDGSDNTLYVLTSDGTQTTATVAATLSSREYTLCKVTLPAGAASVTGFRISGAQEYSLDEFGDQIIQYPSPSGTLFLDQLVASYGGITDETAPEITLSVSDASVKAVITDAVDGVLTKSCIAVTCDGKKLSFQYDEKSGAVTAALSDLDAGMHRISVFAKDASGNIGRASYDIPAGEDWTPHFTDTKDSWAASYADYLYTSGVTTGYEDGSFCPDQNITRQQFAAMLFRYLGLDASRYENTELPFADADSIAGYAKTAVKALYSIGIISGTEVNGKLYFYPGKNLTRAQAAAMIGRTQEKGYASAQLNFTDAASIPAYSLSYIRTMAAQGIIGGYADGSFRPGANITRGQMAKILYNML